MRVLVKRRDHKHGGILDALLEIVVWHIIPFSLPNFLIDRIKRLVDLRSWFVVAVLYFEP